MRALPILLLCVSNVFMTYAWYGHLKNGARDAPLWIAVLLSWGVAFFEYCFMVPANRLGHRQGFTFAQLKTIQEIVTLTVFVAFAVFYFKEKLAWNHLVGFAFIAAAGFFIFGFAGRGPASASAAAAAEGNAATTGDALEAVEAVEAVEAAAAAFGGPDAGAAVDAAPPPPA